MLIKHKSFAFNQHDKFNKVLVSFFEWRTCTDLVAFVIMQAKQSLSFYVTMRRLKSLLMSSLSLSEGPLQTSTHFATFFTQIQDLWIKNTLSYKTKSHYSIISVHFSKWNNVVVVLCLLFLSLYFSEHFLSINCVMRHLNCYYRVLFLSLWYINYSRTLLIPGKTAFPTRAAHCSKRMEKGANANINTKQFDICQ